MADRDGAPASRLRGRKVTGVLLATTRRTMPFQDRTDAGRQLAAKLAGYADRDDVVVLALPRGGVPVAFEVARCLRAPLAALLVRRLAAPADNHVTIGALASGGVRCLDADLIDALGLPDATVEREAARAQAELAAREDLYRGHLAEEDLSGRTAILVDDGIATGASMSAAVTVMKARLPAAVVVAVPVASFAASAALRPKVREFVYCFVRDPIYSVGLWYASYPPVSDEEACRLLERAARDRGEARAAHSRRGRNGT